MFYFLLTLLYAFIEDQSLRLTLWGHLLASILVFFLSLTILLVIEFSTLGKSFDQWYLVWVSAIIAIWLLTVWYFNGQQDLYVSITYLVVAFLSTAFYFVLT